MEELLHFCGTRHPCSFIECSWDIHHTCVEYHQKITDILPDSGCSDTRQCSETLPIQLTEPTKEEKSWFMVPPFVAREEPDGSY